MTTRLNIPCTDLAIKTMAKHGFRLLNGQKLELPSQEGPFATTDQYLPSRKITARVQENEPLELIQIVVECPQGIPPLLEDDLLLCALKADAVA